MTGGVEYGAVLPPAADEGGEAETDMPVGAVAAAIREHIAPLTTRPGR